jgi:hypothetical protein
MTVEAMRVGQVVLVQDSRRPASAGGQLQAWALVEWAELLRAVRLRGPAPVGVSSEFFGHVAVDVIGLEELLLGLDRHEKLVGTFREKLSRALPMRSLQPASRGLSRQPKRFPGSAGGAAMPTSNPRESGRQRVRDGGRTRRRGRVG